MNSAVLGDSKVGSAFEARLASSGHRVIYGTRIPPSSTARGSEFGWSVMAPGRPAPRACAAISRELGHRGPRPAHHRELRAMATRCPAGRPAVRERDGVLTETGRPPEPRSRPPRPRSEE